MSRPSILGVVETQIDKYRVEGLAKTLGFDHAFGVGSSGRSGGLCIFWKNPMVMSLRNFSKYHIDMEVRETGEDPWRITVWYGEANRSLRYKTWDMLRFLKADCDLPWVNIGDFNEVLHREEQIGPNVRDISQINLFREVVHACQLTDLGYIGLDWTFERKIQNDEFCRVRLDRALASTEWCSWFPFATLHHLHAVKSDHSPILLLNEMEAHNQRIAVNKPFRYEVMWERHDQFESALKSAWGDGRVSNVKELRDKLQNTAAGCLRWGSTTFGAVRQELRELRKKLAQLRSDPIRVGPSYEERKVEERIAELGYREEIMWRQRARVQWLVEGDKYTRFFHQKVNMRRKKNNISRLTRPNGTICDHPSELQEMTREFYEDLYKSEGTIGIEEVLSHVPTKVTPEMNATLLSAYIETEVKEALFQMCPTKALGPDGFPAHFFQKHLAYVW